MTDLSKHPCFNKEARHTHARVHLPVAPQCNIKCNYCNRKYDCVNESRPGVTSSVLKPQQALAYLHKLVGLLPNLSVVGIAGPGDPFATPDTTIETLELVRRDFPDMLLCVSTNGLNVGPYVKKLKELNVSHITITLNGLDPEITAPIYGWVREGKQGHVGKEAAKALLARQLAAIDAIKAEGIMLKINTIVIPGVNDHHIPEIAKRMAELGADTMNAIPLYPVAETIFADITEPSAELMKTVRKSISDHLKPMEHCARCRADAAGLLGHDSAEAMQLLQEAANEEPTTNYNDRPNVAVASYEGMLVNQHLGEADVLYIFRQSTNGYRLLEQRATPPSGTGDNRWKELAEHTLSDCRAILVGGIGPKPSGIIKAAGIQVIEMSGLIDQGLDAVYNDTELRCVSKTEMFKCGSSCKGNAQGCG